MTLNDCADRVISADLLTMSLLEAVANLEISRHAAIMAGDAHFADEAKREIGRQKAAARQAAAAAAALLREFLAAEAVLAAEDA